MTFVLWMTGRPCSGKTTIAKKLEEIIPNLAMLDGDSLYEWLGPYDFSRESRIAQNKRVSHLAKLLIKHDVPVCVSMISPYEETRNNARRIIDNKKFYLVYVECDITVCEKRDTKEMYKQARSGKIKNFTGIDDVFDEPKSPDIIINTNDNPIDTCVEKILRFIEERDT